MAESYRRGLGADELLRVVARLLRMQRRADGLICSYLADLADGLIRVSTFVLVYGDVYQLARYKLGLSLRSSRERVRVGRALRQLPILRSALMAGDLPYSRVREVTRVARPDNERQWLRAARDLSMRQLEQRVAAGSKHAVRVPSGTPRPSSTPAPSDVTVSVTPGPASTPAPSEPTVKHSLHLPPHVWMLLEQAMSGAREQSPEPLTDIEAVECVVRAALVQQSTLRPAATPPQQTLRAAIARHEAADSGGIEVLLGTATQSGPESLAVEGAGVAQQPWTDSRRESETRPPAHAGGLEPDERPATQSGSARQDAGMGGHATQSGSARQDAGVGGRATQSGSARQDAGVGGHATQSGSPPGDVGCKGDQARVAGNRRQAPRGEAYAFAGFDAEQSTVEPRLEESTTELGHEQSTTGPGHEQSTTEPDREQSTTEPGHEQSATEPDQEQWHEGATQFDSARESIGRRGTPLSSDAKQLLELIKGGRLWNVATLACETGMPWARLTVALTDLEFSRRVRRDVVGFYEVVEGDGDNDPPFWEVS